MEATITIDIDAIVAEVIDNLDFSDIATEIARHHLDMADIASEVADELDIDDLADRVQNELDIDELREQVSTLSEQVEALESVLRDIRDAISI